LNTDKLITILTEFSTLLKETLNITDEEISQHSSEVTSPVTTEIIVCEIPEILGNVRAINYLIGQRLIKQFHQTPNKPPEMQVYVKFAFILEELFWLTLRLHDKRLLLERIGLRRMEGNYVVVKESVEQDIWKLVKEKYAL
jgi:hypothetical protein